MRRDGRNSEWSWFSLAALIVLQIWTAHAFAFFAHEYAHAFTAWLMGWKSNPFALHFPRLTLIVWIVQLGINQNVDEGPIFAAGHGTHAAIIAAAGWVLGNAMISYPLSRWGFAKATQAGSRRWAMLAYWCTVASIGNFLDYVPVRTFTLEGDMGSVQRGLNISPWMIVAVLGIPTLFALIYFFVRIEPETLRWLFPESAAQRIVVAVLTAFALFGFYGAAGLLEDGPTSHKISVVSFCLFFPLMAVVGSIVVGRKPSTSVGNTPQSLG